MRNGCNQQYLHHHHNLQKSTFLPMLCSKPSIKDVVIPKYDDRSPSPAASFSDDPLSPRVGCMGQVKRKNHRVSIFPSNTSSHNFNISTTKFNNNSDNNNNNIRYFKLKKLFSSKNLITPTTTTTAIATTTSTSGGSSSCRSRRQMMMMMMNMNMDGSDENYARINVADLDPPLPVVKKVQNRAEESSSIGGGGEENLWNRRRKRSSALKTLEIQQIHIPNQFLQPASV